MLNIAVLAIVNGIIALVDRETPSDDTKRCITIMVKSMFNWTKNTDMGDVGFQLQQIILMLQPDHAQEIPCEVLGNAYTLFMQKLEEYTDSCHREQHNRMEARRAARRAALRAQQDAMQPAIVEVQVRQSCSNTLHDSRMYPQ